MYRLICNAFLLAILSLALAAKAADTQNCAEIVDDAKRLHCYDQMVAEAGTDADSVGTPVGQGIWDQRILQDADRETFTLTAHKPNYITYSYLDSPNRDQYEFTGEADKLDHTEIKFQLNFQTKLADNLFDRQADLWFGYTQVSYWQLFGDDISAPFRETNYLPEVYASFLTDYDILGLKGRAINLGIVHQSNGRGQPLSRSWDRIYAEFFFVRDDFALSLKPWYRIKESASDDDNPDIEDFMGNYEIRVYQRRGDHLFSLMLRNLFDSEDRYNSELQWSFPIQRRLRGLVQYYDGYGENMIDHDHKNQRIAFGILMTDWL